MAGPWWQPGFCSRLKSWMKIACLRSIDTQYSIIRLRKSIKSVSFFPARGLGTAQKPETSDPQERGHTFPLTTPPKPEATGCILPFYRMCQAAPRDWQQERSSLVWRMGSGSGCRNIWSSWKMHRKQLRMGGPWDCSETSCGQWGRGQETRLV